MLPFEFYINTYKYAYKNYGLQKVNVACFGLVWSVKKKFRFQKKHS